MIETVLLVIVIGICIAVISVIWNEEL